MRLHLVTEHPRKPPHYDEFVRITAQLQAEVANFDHVPFVLVAELEGALASFSRSQAERIQESF